MIAEQQHMPVGICLFHVGAGKRAAGAGPGLHHNVLPKAFGRLLRNQPGGDVHRASGSLRMNDGHRPRWIGRALRGHRGSGGYQQ